MSAISTAFVQQYSDMLQHLVQQKGSRLRDTVRVDMNFTGEKKFYDQLGSTTVVELTTRHQDTPIIDPNHQRRMVQPVSYAHAFLLDRKDELSMLLDPRSGYAEAQAYAFGRKLDSVILTQAVGTAYSGQTGSTSTTLASYDSGSHEITNTGLDIATILEVKRLLDLADTNPEDPRFFIVTAREIEDLLNTTEVKSSDYNTVKALAMGDLDTFCGFKFIVTNQVSRSSTVNTCVAYTQSGIQVAMRQDLQVEVDKRPDKVNSTQILSTMDFGAVRLEEAKVVKVTITDN